MSALKYNLTGFVVGFSWCRSSFLGVGFSHLTGEFVGQGVIDLN